MWEIFLVVIVFVELFNRVEDMFFLGVYCKNFGMKKMKFVVLLVLFFYLRFCGMWCCFGDGVFF